MAASFSVLLLNVFCSLVSSLYFHIGDGEQKCFIEEIPDETTLIGYYRIQWYDQQREREPMDAQDLSVFVQVKDPDDMMVLSRVCNAEGSFTFMSQTPGQHHICLHSASSPFSLFSSGGILTVHLDIRIGEHTNNYTQIEAEEKLSKLQLRVRQLAAQVEHIQKGLDYYRLQERHWLKVDHNIHVLLFWWSFVRSLYVVVIIIWFTKSW
ncbi:transmembrane emp24 domain-containing protein 9-like [Thalassophryne amazonica]|uniref:transmembrane emp24 domain-containing protein 9-like n=1 Tax=Thalassophryne amazonica TaxID=390379 RepID=UPI0014709CD7|nr:transmembrane emp24 domain-containing protein 9-like [Thalassophryne amazonica]